MNAHADMFIVVEHNELNTPRDIYRSLALGYEILQDSKLPKQALINAFYTMSANFWFATAKLQQFFHICKYHTRSRTKKSPLMQNINGEIYEMLF